MHNWLPWKEARKGKQQAIILTPVSRNWNPLTISADDRAGSGDVGMFITWAFFPACCRLCIDMREDVGFHYNQDLCLIPVLMGSRTTAAKHLHMWACSFKKKKKKNLFCFLPTISRVNQVEMDKYPGLSMSLWMQSLNNQGITLKRIF